MHREIKSLKEKSETPPIWSMFLDGTTPPSFSYTRIVGFMVITVFLALAAYLSISSGALIIPDKSWVYILISFAAAKPVQRFAESKDNENQLNYDFQMAQLDMGKEPEKTVDKPEGT